MSGPNSSSAIDMSGEPPDAVMYLRPIDVSDSIAAQIPDGQVISVDTAQMFGAPPGYTPRDRSVLPVITAGGSGGSAAMIGTLNRSLINTGFTSAVPGGNSIGLIAIPRAWTRGAIPPESATVWGHTATFVRVNGKIQIVRGYVPESFVDAAMNFRSIPAGRTGVPATISNDLLLFTNTGARTVEWPVNAEMALRMSNELPKPGAPPAGGPQLYTGRSAMYRGISGQAANCVDWACSTIESTLGGKVGRVGPGGTTTPLVNPATPEAGLQGEMMKFMNAGSKDGRIVAPMPNATGEAIVASMPRYIRLLKIGGRVMILIGAGMVVYETYKAPAGQGGRTFTREAAGFGGGIGGGILGGMAAGAVCGPGVLVCSIVFGMVGGVIGYYVASESAEAIYDYAAEDRYIPAPRVKLNSQPNVPWSQNSKNPWPDGTPGNGRTASLRSGPGSGAGAAGLSKDAQLALKAMGPGQPYLTPRQIVAKAPDYIIDIQAALNELYAAKLITVQMGQGKITAASKTRP